MMISLYSPFIACISAILSIPVFGAGLGGGGGGGAAPEEALDPIVADLVDRLAEGASTLLSGLWTASLAS